MLMLVDFLILLRQISNIISVVYNLKCLLQAMQVLHLSIQCSLQF